jgi:hypothetical protein
MSVGAVRLGALNVYRNRTGPLTTEQHTDAAIVAGVADRALITMQTGADPGTLGVELEAGSNLRLVVHQATGVVAEQLEITVTEALIRLRAYAFAAPSPTSPTTLSLDGSVSVKLAATRRTGDSVGRLSAGAETHVESPQ